MSPLFCCVTEAFSPATTDNLIAKPETVNARSETMDAKQETDNSGFASYLQTISLTLRPQDNRFRRCWGTIGSAGRRVAMTVVAAGPEAAVRYFFANYLALTADNPSFIAKFAET